MNVLKNLLKQKISLKVSNIIANLVLKEVRQEYTVMPRFSFHQPLDYNLDTWPAKFGEPIRVETEEIVLPAIEDRMGYAADDQEYLAWGRDDKEHIMKFIRKYENIDSNIAILDFGCSTGRILRHFWPNIQENNWNVYGVDIQARTIQWIREYFPQEFQTFTCTMMPHLPFEDNSLDVIYGISVFTHTKYLWDMWLMELRRCLKPNGLLIQTIHSEHAWNFYAKNKHVQWVQSSHSAKMLQQNAMNVPYFYYGDISVSQVFWKKEVAREYWSRYFEVLEIMEPPDHRSFQDWMICRKT